MGSGAMTEPLTPAPPQARCPKDNRPLKKISRFVCPHCQNVYRDNPTLYGAPKGRAISQEVGGKPINMLLGEALQDQVEAEAANNGMARALMIRTLLQEAIDARRA